jgi:metal-responsive CopG/Arc/MetJ family transcriptional regulator
MRKTITISIPSDIQKRLDESVRRLGVSRSDVVRESLRDYLFVEKFRDLRAKMTARVKARGVFTDQDVFDRVS